jgi:hypothetical protein
LLELPLPFRRFVPQLLQQRCCRPCSWRILIRLAMRNAQVFEGGETYVGLRVVAIGFGRDWRSSGRLRKWLCMWTSAMTLGHPDDEKPHASDSACASSVRRVFFSRTWASWVSNWSHTISTRAPDRQTIATNPGAVRLYGRQPSTGLVQLELQLYSSSSD